MRNIKWYSPLSREEERGLAIRWAEHGDVGARDQLVASGEVMVVRIARRHKGYGIPVEDLIQEGRLGLLEAAERFEPYRERRFGTYAVYWVRAYILAYILKNSRMVRLGMGPAQSKVFFNLARIRAKLQLNGGTESVDVEELAEEIGVSTRSLEATASRLDRPDLSLDAPAAFRDSKATVGDQTASRSLGPDRLLADAEAAAQTSRLLEAALGGLDTRDRFIISRRFRADGDADTLQKIGDVFGISRERVRQLEKAAKQKLRAFLEQHHGLKGMEGEPGQIIMAMLSRDEDERLLEAHVAGASSGSERAVIAPALAGGKEGTKMNAEEKKAAAEKRVQIALAAIRALLEHLPPEAEGWVASSAIARKLDEMPEWQESGGVVGPTMRALYGRGLVERKGEHPRYYYRPPEGGAAIPPPHRAKNGGKARTVEGVGDNYLMLAYEEIFTVDRIGSGLPAMLAKAIRGVEEALKEVPPKYRMGVCDAAIRFAAKKAKNPEQ